MLKIRLVTASDAPPWQTYVAGHGGALLGHQFAWFHTIPQALNIRPIYFLAESDQSICGIAPFFVRSHIGLGKRLTSMPYLNTGGILADSPEIRDQLWAFIQDWATENKVKTIELRNRYDKLPEFPIRHGRTTSIIPLPDTEDAAWNAMKSVARNRIRKAQKHGLQVKHGFDYFDGFWGAYAENMLALGAPVLAKKWFLTLADTPELRPHMITLWQGDQIAAGMVLLGFKDGVENGWTSSTMAARNLYSNDLLYWSAIQWGVSEGLTWLDLGRSEAGGGHERFKSKFGAETVPLPYQEIERKSFNAWLGVTEEPTALYQAFQTVWKKLPLSFATRIGSYFSRQVY